MNIIDEMKNDFWMRIMHYQKKHAVINACRRKDIDDFAGLKERHSDPLLFKRDVFRRVAAMEVSFLGRFFSLFDRSELKREMMEFLSDPAYSDFNIMRRLIEEMRHQIQGQERAIVSSADARAYLELQSAFQTLSERYGRLEEANEKLVTALEKQAANRSLHDLSAIMPPNERLDLIEQRLAEVTAYNNRLNAKNKRLTEENSAFRRERGELTGHLAEAEQTIRSLQARCDEYLKTIGELERQREEQHDQKEAAASAASCGM